MGDLFWLHPFARAYAPIFKNTYGRVDLGHGSTVVLGVHTAKAIGAGDFAHENQNPTSVLVTEDLAGVATNALRSPQNPSSWFVRSSTSSDYVRKTSTAFRNGDFNIFTGKFTVAPAVVKQCMYSIDTAADSCDPNVADHAATHPRTSTSAKTFTFKTGAKVPVTVAHPMLGGIGTHGW